jgi:hypothetical protein
VAGALKALIGKATGVQVGPAAAGNPSVDVGGPASAAAGGHGITATVSAPVTVKPLSGGTALRQLLDPVSAGADLARHLAAFQPGTREWVFADIEKWARLPQGAANRRVFWLRGTGGLGKSVIAAQLVARYGQKAHALVLGDVSEAGDPGGESSTDQVAAPQHSASALTLCAYFFCKHDDQARNDPRRVVATLAFRLACMLPAMWARLEAMVGDGEQRQSLQEMLGGTKGNLSDLYNFLLAEPLQAALAETADGS